jgi:hypothetical protein
MMSNVKEVLVRAKDLVSEGWTQQVFARDRDEAECHYSVSRACKFCLVGAIYRAKSELGLGEEVADAIREILLKKLRIKFIGHWNDAADRKKSEVVHLLEAVIREVGDE